MARPCTSAVLVLVRCGKSIKNVSGNMDFSAAQHVNQTELAWSLRHFTEQLEMSPHSVD